MDHRYGLYFLKGYGSGYGSWDTGYKSKIYILNYNHIMVFIFINIYFICIYYIIIFFIFLYFNYIE